MITLRWNQLKQITLRKIPPCNEPPFVGHGEFFFTPQGLIPRRVTTLLPGKTLLGMSQPVPVHPEPKCSNVARPNTLQLWTSTTWRCPPSCFGFCSALALQFTTRELCMACWSGQKIAISVLVLSFCNTQHMPGQRSHALGRLWSIAPHLTRGGDSHARDRVSCLFHAFFPAIFEHVWTCRDMSWTSKKATCTSCTAATFFGPTSTTSTMLWNMSAAFAAVSIGTLKG